MNLRIPGTASIRWNFFFPGKLLRKPEFIVLGLAVALSLYWVFDTAIEILAIHGHPENVSLSALGVGAQSLDTRSRGGNFAHIAEYRTWDLPPHIGKAGGAGQGGHKPWTSASFAQKEFNNIPAVYSLADENYRWELYGVVGNGRKRAVFFNPMEKDGENFGWRQFVPGQHLDDDLALKEIGKDRVVIFFGREQKDFVLELFRVNQP